MDQNNCESSPSHVSEEKLVLSMGEGSALWVFAAGCSGRGINEVERLDVHASLYQ